MRLLVLEPQVSGALGSPRGLARRKIQNVKQVGTCCQRPLLFNIGAWQGGSGTFAVHLAPGRTRDGDTSDDARKCDCKNMHRAVHVHIF